MDDTMKIGPRVPENIWIEFKQHVEEKHGKTRGVIGEELAQALREYLGETDEHDLERQLEQILRRQEQVSLKLDDLEAEMHELKDNCDGSAGS